MSKNIESKLRGLDIHSIRIGKCGEITDNIPKGVLNEGLKKFLGGLDLTITVCSGACRPIPEEERRRVMQDHHDSLFGEHRGMDKTYRRIRKRFYWKGIKQKIHDFVKRCEICQMRKLTCVKINEPMVIPDTLNEPFAKIAIDTVGPLPITTSGNQHILTMQCLLSKFFIAVSMPNIKVITIAEALARHLLA